MTDAPVTFPVTVQTVGPWRIAALRHVGPYQELGPSFERIGAWAGPKGLFTPDTPMVGVFHDNPQEVAPADLRSDAGVIVGEDVALDLEGLHEVRIPQHRAAVMTYTGSYEGLPGAYPQLGAWLQANGENWAVPAPSVEAYLDDPSSTPIDRVRTLIHAPLS